MAEDFSVSGDGQQWARAFIKAASQRVFPVDFTLDEATLTSWFANAIERGKQIGRDEAYTELTGVTYGEAFVRDFNGPNDG